jgi:hypothetical protein
MGANNVAFTINSIFLGDLQPVALPYLSPNHEQLFIAS